MDILKTKKPISLIITEKNKDLSICCVIGKSSSFSLHAVICNDNDGFLHCGLWYCPLSILKVSSMTFNLFNFRTKHVHDLYR